MGHDHDQICINIQGIFNNKFIIGDIGLFEKFDIAGYSILLYHVLCLFHLGIDTAPGQADTSGKH
jgi:hypothetical protein